MYRQIKYKQKKQLIHLEKHHHEYFVFQYFNKCLCEMKT